MNTTTLAPGDQTENRRVVSDSLLLKRCSKCVMPETQEVIAFDAEGVCNACRNNEFKQEKIDWSQKEQQWLNFLEDYRGKYDYDCIIPFSGGKDSTFTAWALKDRYNLKPLIVSFDHHLLRPQTLENRERTLKRLGIDFLSFRPDWHLVKKTMRVSLERKGDILWYQHSGIFSYPMQIAVKFNVPLVVWGEPQAEYTGYYGYDEQEEVDERRFNMFVNLGITAQDMLGMLNEHPKFKEDLPVTMRDMQPFIYPARADLRAIKCRSVCLGSYIPWDVKKQVKIIEKELGWEGDRVEGVPPEFNYEKIEDMMQGVQDYLKFIKRGYGRMSHLCSIDIRNGRMTREEAMEKIGKWEGKRPGSLDVFLKWMDMSEDELYAIVSPLAVAPWKHDPTRTQREDPLPDQKDWITG
ncbi:N-acetyl sugar amidotransferase [Candidatus Peregrinibacteria bacterium]|nr:N-acetyl sugar amidotransferase [Candidatus Peregrinibacteria bacterium]